jgi:hypothetical protein
MKLAVKLATKTETDFDPQTRAVGRALVRRRRVKLLDCEEAVTCAEIRAPDGPVVVLLVADRARACSCDGGTPRARCAHAWAAILARDRHLARSALLDGRAHPEHDVEGRGGQ